MQTSRYQGVKLQKQIQISVQKLNLGSAKDVRCIRQFVEVQNIKNKNSISFFSRGITLKRVFSGGYYLQVSTLGQQSCEETSQRRRAFGNNVSRGTRPGIQPKTSRADIDLLNHYVERSVSFSFFSCPKKATEVPDIGRLQTL